jgi:hypothetical protein
LTLPPLDHRGYVRPRRGGRIRTVPTSRVSSSKLSRLEPVSGKRSRSANNKAGQIVEPISDKQVLGSDWLTRLDPLPGKRSRSASEEPELKLLVERSPEPTSKGKVVEGDKIGRRRLSKVETVRVLRARSALMLPLPSPPLVPHFHPLVLKSDGTEERKKKRR